MLFGSVTLPCQMDRAGFCVWFTGLPSAGKTTLANHLTRVIEARGRRVTNLDGDVVRTHLSRELGFSREDRDTNVLRIGWVASQIVVHGGVVVCAVVSPYEKTREQLRKLFGEREFMLVHVDTPAEICEARDAKGMYAQARAGVIRGFTGVDDPYERPLHPDLRLNTEGTGPDVNAGRILQYLEDEQFLAR
jgi:sulfate adenylyltransferase